MDELERLFTNLDYFAKRASNIDLSEHSGIFRSKHIASDDNSEQRAYFCAVPKSNFICIGAAFPLLFIHCLHDFNEWEKNNTSHDVFDKTEWENELMTFWIPEFLGVSKGSTLAEYKTVKEDDFRSSWFSIANKIAELAILSPIKRIVRYGEINAWNIYNYLIETETEYIDFQYWTTA